MPPLSELKNNLIVVQVHHWNQLDKKGGASVNFNRAEDSSKLSSVFKGVIVGLFGIKYLITEAEMSWAFSKYPSRPESTFQNLTNINLVFFLPKFNYILYLS